MLLFLGQFTMKMNTAPTVLRVDEGNDKSSRELPQLYYRLHCRRTVLLKLWQLLADPHCSAEHNLTATALEQLTHLMCLFRSASCVNNA